VLMARGLAGEDDSIAALAGRVDPGAR
jgi:hypothetical protein